MFTAIGQFVKEISALSLRIITLGVTVSLLFSGLFLHALYIAPTRHYLYYISMAKSYSALALSLPVVFMILACLFDLAAKQQGKE